MRWKIATVLLLVAFIWTLIWAIRAASDLHEAEAVVEKYAVEKLKEKGFREGTFTRPSITEVPIGTKPISHVTGMVHFAPKSGASSGAGAIDSGSTVASKPVSITEGSSPTPLDVPRETIPCNLDELDVTMRCTVDTLATSSHPWAKLVQSGTIKAWGQTLELPPTAAGEIHLQVTPAVVSPKWHADLLAGVAVGSRYGMELGASWTNKSRLGPYFLVEWQPATGGSSYDSYSESYYSSGDPATWRIHAGLRVRLK